MKTLILSIVLSSLFVTTPSFSEDMSKRNQGGGSNQISQTEVEGLEFMREEEKMARDVYLQFHETYGVRVFRNIALSEQSHMNTILKMMELYNIPDSATDVIGLFNNSDLQELYDLLVELGSFSVVDAYLVGALIEETDIKDIEEIKETVTSPNIIKIYDNLLCGSRNHMRSFVERYETATGNVYQVQIPEMAETVADILNSHYERCGKK